MLPGFKPDIARLANWNSAKTPSAAQASNPAKAPQASAAEGNRVRKAVEIAWSKLSDRASFERGYSWGEAGGDSLKAMELIFSIEKALDLTVPLEFLDQSTTPKALIESLDRLLAAPRPSRGSWRTDEKIPLVFLMPGVSGDEPALAMMRAELRARLRFVTIKYPSESAMFEADASFDAVADAAIAQIRGSAASDDIVHLAGYSFGGFVAWEVACRLQAAGYRIGTIGLIDARRTRLLAGRGANSILDWARHLFYLRLPLPVLSSLHTWTARLPTSMAVRLPRNYDRELRRRGLNRFRPAMLDHPVTLFRSTEYTKEFPDNGWSEVCPQLTIVPIDGTHASMLVPPCRAVLAERLFETIAAAEAKHPQSPRSGSLPGTAA